MAKLTLDKVSKRFGDGSLAVAEVSLTVEPGTFLALLGPSGCGKTTLLRMLAGFEEPSEGAIAVDGRLVAGPDRFVPPEERNMAMVFQSYALWPHMSVGENIGYPLKIRGIRGAEYDRRVAGALETVHMAGFGARRPHELSGGQRQRVALARCLVSDPAVVLLDEPLANLDRHLRAAMEETFREFHARTGATMIYVTHDQAEAMALADRIAVMAKGRLLQVDPPEVLYRKPNSRAVAELIGHGSILPLSIGTDDGRDLGSEALADAVLARDYGPMVADIFVRPEDVVVDGEGPLALRVITCVFKGERYALTLSSETGDMLLAYSATARRIGDIVPCRLLRGWRL